MSYFLFGAFNSVNNVKKLQQIKANGLENDIYIWFDEEITFYKDIQRILTEQKAKGKIRFAITSKIKCIIVVIFFFRLISVKVRLCLRTVLESCIGGVVGII